MGAIDYDGAVLDLCPYHYRFWVGERLTIELEQARWTLAESMADDDQSPGDKRSDVCDDGACTIRETNDRRGPIR